MLFYSLYETTCYYGHKWDQLKQKCIGKYIYSITDWFFFSSKILYIDNSIFVECDLGFYGYECKNPCDYPSYGAKCVLTCNCSKEECHFINGCRKSKLVNHDMIFCNITL